MAMKLFLKFINEKDLQAVFTNLMSRMTVDGKKVFIKKQFSTLIEESLKDLSAEEKILFLQSISKITEEVISTDNQKEGKNPDYMCC